MGILTWVLRVLWAHVVVAGVQDILVHERRTRRHLSEEGNLDRLANFDTLTLLHKNLSGVLAPVLAVQRWHTVLLRVVSLLEGLEGSHEIMPSSNTVGNNSLGDTGGNGTLDDSSDGIHGTDDLGLELGRHVELDLLEEVLGRTETTNHEHVLQKLA